MGWEMLKYCNPNSLFVLLFALPSSQARRPPCAVGQFNCGAQPLPRRRRPAKPVPASPCARPALPALEASTRRPRPFLYRRPLCAALSFPAPRRPSHFFGGRHGGKLGSGKSLNPVAACFAVQRAESRNTRAGHISHFPASVPSFPFLSFFLSLFMHLVPGFGPLLDTRLPSLAC